MDEITINRVTYTKDGIYIDGELATIGRVTYAENGIYVDGKLVYANDVWHIEPQDYVGVIRCKDCGYYRESQWVIATDVPSVCTFFANGVQVEPDGFCKWAKRKQ